MITNDDLLFWINEMPLWVRKATMLFYQNNTISDDDIRKLTGLCFVDDTNYKVEGVNLINHGERRGYAIKSISNVEGVNALVSSKPLEFSPKGITVVYGLNGAGKSGYIRVFKMVAGAKYREEIKSNIYSGTKVSPKANISLLREDGESFLYSCDLKKPGQYEELRSIDIFDTKISTAYVNDAKEATYEPWVFSLFSTLADVATRIKSELKKEKAICNIQELIFTDEMKTSELYKLVEGLSWKSQIDEFPDVWSDEDEADLINLEKKNQIDTIVAQINTLTQQLPSLKSLLLYYSQFATFFEKFDQIRQSKIEWEEAERLRKASELLFAKNADELDANSVDVKTWRELWKYARNYYDEIIGVNDDKKFGELGGRCPLCGQNIEHQDIADRLLSIDSYVNGETVGNEERKRKEYVDYLNGFPKIKGEKELRLLFEAADFDYDRNEIKSCEKELRNFANSILLELSQISLVNIDVSIVIDEIKSRIKLIEDKIKELNDLAQSDEQKKLLKQIITLKTKKQLVMSRETIENNIKAYARIHEIESVEKKLTTNKITSKSKELAEQMITSEYVNRFDSELKELTKNGLEVKIEQQKAGGGKIPYKVVLCDAEGKRIAPQDILSEGENRVTSLAAFFAESSGRSENTPLIVDDPISSLDYTYESKVIERLIKAALKRQVIVFTHRISMVVGLYEGTKDNPNIPYKEISLQSNRKIKGVPTEYSDIGGKSKTQLNELIDKKLRKLKGLDEFSQDYKVLFHNICQDFRNIVEKSVEDVLLADVVKRFRRDIQTKNRIEKLANITIEDCRLVEQMMTKYSYYDHSMSDETPLQEISYEELEKDLLDLQAWIKSKA